MEKLARFGLTRRTALLLVLLAVLSTSGVLMVPKDAEAACCGWYRTTVYWYDAAKTQYAGECWVDGCTQDSGCEGVQTSYWSTSRFCCETCVS